MKRECPNCYSKWAWREAWPSTEKILFNRKGRKMVHGVVSFESETKFILESRKSVYAILKKHGILSGVLIPHHTRKGKIDGYLHYHFLGYVGYNNRYLPGVKGQYVFKVIRWLNGPSDTVRTIHYFLTHCAVVDGRHAITYFGEKFKKPKQQQKKLDDWCPICFEHSARTVPIIDFNGGYMVNVHTGCMVEGGG
jgi:hypothetical protein